MADFWSYIRTNFALSFLTWKGAEGIVKLLGALLTLSFILLHMNGYAVSFSPELLNGIGAAVVLWFVLLFIVVTPYRMWRSQLKRIRELEADLKSVEQKRTRKDKVWAQRQT